MRGENGTNDFRGNITITFIKIIFLNLIHYRVLIYGGNTPVGCILTQLIKLWGGYVVTACRLNAIPISKALGADDVIPLDDSDIEKELKLHDKYV